TDYQFVFGTEPDKAIIKVDQYTIQFHLQRTYADLFTLFDIVLPQHILDPNYDALGLGSGVRADGTSASVYKDWMMDDYNQGMRTSGDIQYPATIGTGAYMLYPGENRTENSVTLTTWNHYFKDTDTSYWAPLVANRPDKYKHDFIPNRDVANTMLDQGEIDIKCSQYQGEPYPIFGCSRPGVTVDKCLDWGYHTMGYNILHGADDHLTNKWVRLAISHVIPRQEIVDYVLGGLGQPSFVPFPQQSPYLPENLEPIKYNISRAFDYLERAEYDVTPFREDWIRQNPSVQSSNYVEVLFSSNLAFLGIIGIEIAIVVVLFMFIRRKRKN
ncbi:MAG: ABC transporter substrate-binding protein, partial [Candidatus Hodarchaeota archaeon]